MLSLCNFCVIAMNPNVYETLSQAAQTWPLNIAVTDESGSITFAELFKETDKLRQHLVSKGIGKNHGIGILTKNNRHFLITLYAGIGAGSVVMPIAHQQRADEISKAWKEANLHFILTDNPDLKIEGNKSTEIPGHQIFIIPTGKSIHEPTVLPFVNDPAVMRFTSGTTGEAKCVILSHRSVLERIEAANEGLRLNDSDKVVWVLPMAYHFIVSLMLYIRYGAGLIICNDFLAENVIEKIRRHDGTLLYASPMHIRLLASCKKDSTLPSLKRVISTTTSISIAICKTFKEKYKLPVSQAFGIIEVGLPILNLERSEDNPQAVGHCLPSYEAAILDKDFNPVHEGTTGLLAIKGPGMFDGYLSPPTPREDVLKQGWFITGDYATCSSTGLIEIKGREKAVINVSGNKVFPNEVEDIINLFPGIIRSRVYGQQHPLLGEVVAADIMLQNATGFNEEELIRHCHKMLSSFKVPHRIKIVDEIEMTGSGKVKR